MRILRFNRFSLFWYPNHTHRIFRYLQTGSNEFSMKMVKKFCCEPGGWKKASDARSPSLAHTMGTASSYGEPTKRDEIKKKRCWGRSFIDAVPKMHTLWFCGDSNRTGRKKAFRFFIQRIISQMLRSAFDFICCRLSRSYRAFAVRVRPKLEGNKDLSFAKVFHLSPGWWKAIAAWRTNKKMFSTFSFAEFWAPSERETSFPRKVRPQK